MTDAGPPEGLLLVDKPAGYTSHDVVATVRRLARTRRVGHAGTLDPMATGVLVLGIGRATKLLTFLVGCDKGYAATIRLGVSTVTDDAEGEVTASTGVTDELTGRVPAAIAELTGTVIQVPSSVSAIKVDGVRAYAKVRGGQEVTLAGRPVTVSRFEVLATRHTHAHDGTAVLDLAVEVDVSSGTYVRALARDLGAALGVGGHLTALRRTRVGSFLVSACHPLPALNDAAASRSGLPIIPLGDAARAALPTRTLTEQEALAVSHGRPLDSRATGEGVVAVFGPDGRLVAVIDESGPRARSHVVFTPGGS